MTIRNRSIATAFILATGAMSTLTSCGSTTGNDTATVTQPWTGVSPTGNALDLGVIVAGITDPTGNNRDALTLVPPTADDNRASATCTTNDGEESVHVIVGDWHITATEDRQALTVVDADRGLPAADIDVTTPVAGLPESITFHDDGRIDITAAADTPTAWNIPGRLYVGATITCDTENP